MFEKEAKTIKVEGADLAARLKFVNESRSKAKAPGRYWIAYTFPLRPNVALEAVLTNANGSQIKLGAITGAGPADSTRRAGLFLSHEDKSDVDLNRPTRVELFDLDRAHHWKELSIYWLGSIEADQSLEFLERLIAESHDADACARLAEAAAVHNDPRAEALLKRLACGATFAETRMAAIRWLGRIGGHLDFLAEVVTDKAENSRVREQAVMSIGKSIEPEAIAVLRRLYETIETTSLKMHVITALSKQRASPAAVKFLTSISKSEGDNVLGLHSRAKLDKTQGKKLKKKVLKPLYKQC